MFPEACSLEIKNCLMVASGNVESAVQLMLLKKENVDEEGKENCHAVHVEVQFLLCVSFLKCLTYQHVDVRSVLCL